MATTPKVLLKRSSVIGKVPVAGDLQYGELAINFADGRIYYKDANDAIKNFVDSSIIQDIVRSISTDSAEVINLIQTHSLDSSEIISLIDAGYVQARQDYAYASLTGAPNIQGMIDSEINTLLGGAPAALDTLNELAAAIGDDANFITTINNAIAAQLDSSETIALIDSSHVQLRQDYAYASLTGVPTNVSQFANDANYLDSNTVTGVVDATYIQTTAPQDFSYASLTGAPNVLDSANVSGIITSDVDKAFVDALNVDADTLDGQTGSWYVDWTNTTNKPVILDNVDVDLQIDNRVDKAYVDALNVDADTLDNLNSTQFLRSDQSDSMQGSLTIDNNLTVGGYVAGPATFYIDPAGVGDNTGKVVIKGNLQVDGVQTIVNSTTVSINDKNIVLADSAADSAEADGAGITVNGANAKITYTASTDTWDFNKKVSAPNIDVSGAFVSNTLVGKYLGFDSDFAQKSTDDLTEGSTNQYYLKARVDSDIAASLNDSGNTVTVTINNTIEDKVDSAYVLSRIIDRTDSAWIQPIARKGLSGGTGITYDNITGQISIPQTIGIADSVEFGNVDVSGNLIIGGDLQVQGTTFTANTASFSVDENIFYLNDLESAGSPTQYVDVGFSGNVNDQGSFTHAGFFRDATDATWKVFETYYPLPNTAEINTSDSSFSLGAFEANTLTGQYLGFDSDFGTKTTSNLTEGSNLYYTDARVTSHVDQAFVNGLNVDADNLDGQTGSFYLNYNNLTNTPNVLDSADVTNLIDSAYIAARTSAGTDSATVVSIINSTVDSAYISALGFGAGGGGGTVDSADIIAIVDSAYVQARSNVVAAPLTQSIYNFTADSGQSSFTGLDVDSGKFQVYLNGLLLPRSDFTHNSSKVDLLVAADSGDVLEVIKFSGNDTGAQAIQQRHYIYTADSSQTVFTGADDNGSTLSYTKGRINVYLNGLLLLDSDDYTQTQGQGDSGDTITFTSGVTSGHIVNIQTLSGNTGSFSPLSQTLYEFTADSGQTVFTGVDDNAATLDFSNDKVTVYLNGILLSGTDYTPSGGNRITLDVGADSGNLLTVAKLSGNNIGLDSGQVVSLIDTDYIQARTTAGTDSATVVSIINEYIVQSDSDFTTTGANQVVDTFSQASYRTAKYIVQFSHAVDSKYHSTEVLLIHDGTTVYMTEYAEVKTDSSLGTIDADISGGNVRLLVTPSYTNTGVNVSRTNVTV